MNIEDEEKRMSVSDPKDLIVQKAMLTMKVIR